MNDELKVTVVSFGPTRPLMLRWLDPLTHKRRFKSAKTTKRSKAERAAAALEKAIADGQVVNSPRMPWKDFALLYTEAELPGKSLKTGGNVATVFNHLERIIHPQRLADINESALLHWQQTLRAEGKRESSLASYRATLRAILAWAVRQKFIPRLPEFPDKPKVAKGESPAKCRAVTREEAERMLAKTAGVVGKPAARSWRRLLIGLWWSGLRLGEAVVLDWYTPGARGFCVDLSGRRPMFIIGGEAEKGNCNRLLPMAPEFARFLAKTPEAERVGKVFPLVPPQGSRGGPVWLEKVSEVICKVGKAAGVVVARKMRWDRAAGKQIEKAKYGSAHDFRRAFCFRWSLRVAPLVLKELARHESVATTERYYLTQNSEAMADVAWAAWERGRDGGKAKRGGKRPATRPARNPRAEREAATVNTIVNSDPFEQVET
jgi:integrase